MIWSEWQRFSLIVRARGKAALKPNKVRVRDLGPMIIPLIMALFQRAEDMTIAMEMRKVRENDAFGARSSLLSWSRRDTRIGILGLLVFVLLVSMRQGRAQMLVLNRLPYQHQKRSVFQEKCIKLSVSPTLKVR